MALNQPNINGQATSANSAPVVIASDQVSLNITNTVSALNGDLVPSTDVTGFRSFNIAVTGTFVATYTFQGSNDNFASANSTFSIPVTQVTNSIGGVVVSSGTSNILWKGAINFRYLRIRVTAYTSGSVIGVTNISQVPDPFSTYTSVLNSPSVIQSGTWVTVPGPSTAAGGLTTFSNQSVSNTAVTVKSSTARLYQYDIYNPNTTGVWLQLFNTSAPTVGTTAPVRTLYIPPSSGRDDNGDYSINFSLALTIAATTTATGSTAPTSAISVYMGYV